MRIISGKARGTNLYTLEGLETRPTLDRVKESLFNIINQYIYDSVVLDLFSGSGAIGLEFASRGAKKVYLCDNSKKAVDIINKNIEKTHLSEKIELYCLDFKDCLNKMSGKEFDIIYLDPPYKTDCIKQSLELINKLDILKSDGMIILETDEPQRISKEIENLDFTIFDSRKYGRAYLYFLNKKGA